MNFTINRVALYARFSSENQRQESIVFQLRIMHDYCKQQHWEVVATYTDEAKSATTDNRPQFQQMIADSSKKMFDTVLVLKLDRFSRSRLDSAIYKQRLKKNNVTLRSVMERIDDSPESVMMESVLEGMSEYYSRNLSRLVQAGMNETALQCKHTGGCPPLGYDVGEDRRLVVNEHEAEAVRIIFEMFNEGCGYTAIINYLNEHGYHPKRGGVFGKNSLCNILENEKYIGVFVYNRPAAKANSRSLKPSDKFIRIEGGCPAIVSKELFYRVQKRKRQNRRNTGRYHGKEFYLLTGKVFCGVCGKRIQGNLRFSGSSKCRMATYRCTTRRKDCNNKENNKDYLDVYVVELLREKVFNRSALRKRIKAVNAYIQKYNAMFDKHHERLQAELQSVSESLANITEAVEQGILTKAIIERAEELEQQRSDLQERLNTLRQYMPLEYKDFSHLVEDFKKLPRNSEAFRQFVQQFLDSIVTYPYHLEITLNVGFGVTDELKETITIRRGELYALFESKTMEE